MDHCRHVYLCRSPVAERYTVQTHDIGQLMHIKSRTL
jgi:hypothetical protein